MKWINKDGNNDNISARKAIQMCISIGANDNIIKKIANILRANEVKGFLNLREFQVAIHLIISVINMKYRLNYLIIWENI